MRIDVAAILCQRWLEPLFERFVGVVSGHWLFLGFSLSMGVDTVSFRFVGVLR
jgi:hypothetical protein